MTERATAFEAIQRELYWAGADEVGGLRSPEELRVALHRLSERLRDDVATGEPPAEWEIDRGPRWKRWLKRLLHRMLRPIHRRYDGVAAELAVLAAGLAARLEESEAAVERLRVELDSVRRPPPPRHEEPVAPQAPLDAYRELAQALRGDGDDPVWIDLGAGGGDLVAQLSSWGWRAVPADVVAAAEAGERGRGRGAAEEAGRFLQRYAGTRPRVISVRWSSLLAGPRRGALLEQARRLLGPEGVLLVELAPPLEGDPVASEAGGGTHPESIRLAAMHAGFDRTELLRPGAGRRVILRAEAG